ncbi:helix-turn-helix domain-containing protein [Deinococcus sonorensis]|uniref:Helix-turn-helix domain-containing protein n=1 Tax=Deinococcus sonorensis TaxID=309891 RepID=A0ABV8YB61_9DEIO
MTPPVLDQPGALIPSPEDTAQARATTQLLAQHDGEPLRLIIGDDAAPVVLPSTVARLFQHLLTQLAAGNAVTVLPVQAELTTQQAADLLNVSRPYLIRLLESGEIPFSKVGTHRRVQLQQLLQYREQVRAQQQAALTALTEEGQDLGLY